MDNPAPYTHEYFTGAIHAPAFDRATATAEFVDATIAWTKEQTQAFLIGGNDEELAAAHSRMIGAGAILAWENGRAAQAAGIDPAYDDETIAEMLAGMRG